MGHETLGEYRHDPYKEYVENEERKSVVIPLLKTGFLAYLSAKKDGAGPIDCFTQAREYAQQRTPLMIDHADVQSAFYSLVNHRYLEWTATLVFITPSGTQHLKESL